VCELNTAEEIDQLRVLKDLDSHCVFAQFINAAGETIGTLGKGPHRADGYRYQHYYLNKWRIVGLFANRTGNVLVAWGFTLMYKN
jgi:hypothetical protein